MYTEGFGRKLVARLVPDLIHFHHLKPLVRFLAFPRPSCCRVPVLFTAQGLHVRKYHHRTGLRSRSGKLLRSAL